MTEYPIHPVIYCYHCLVTGKKYIGSTNCEKRRRHSHYANRLSAKLQHLPFYCAINKYGMDQFVYGIIEECDVDMLVERECYWVEYYDSINAGYNCKMPNTSHHTHTLEARERIRQSRIGCTHSQEARDKISRAHKGRMIPQEHRDKISNTMVNNHRNISDWELTFIDGRVIIVTNLKRWCRDNGYNSSAVIRLQHRGHRTKDIIKVIKLKTDIDK